MLEHFRVTLDLLKKVNLINKETNNKEIMSDEEFIEQYENLTDFQNLLEELMLLLEQSNKKLLLNEIESDLHKIHIKYSDYKWHINEIHECIKKVISKLP